MYLCKVCNQEFYSVVDCQAHLESQHTGVEGSSCGFVQYQCPECGMVFSHPVDCQNHALRDHGIQKVECRKRTT